MGERAGIGASARNLHTCSSDSAGSSPMGGPMEACRRNLQQLPVFQGTLGYASPDQSSYKYKDVDDEGDDARSLRSAASIEADELNMRAVSSYLAVLDDLTVDGNGHIVRGQPARTEDLTGLLLGLRQGGTAAQAAAWKLFGLLSDRAACRRVASDAVNAGAVHLLMANLHVADASGDREDRPAWPGSRKCIHYLLELSRTAAARAYEALDNLKGVGFHLDVKLSRFLPRGQELPPDVDWELIAHAAFLISLYIGRGRAADLAAVFAPRDDGGLSLLPAVEAYLARADIPPLAVCNLCFVIKEAAHCLYGGAVVALRTGRLPELLVTEVLRSEAASDLIRALAASALAELVELLAPSLPAMDALLVWGGVPSAVVALLAVDAVWSQNGAGAALRVLVRRPALQSSVLSLLSGCLAWGGPVAMGTALKLLAEAAHVDAPAVAAVALQPLLTLLTADGAPATAHLVTVPLAVLCAIVPARTAIVATVITQLTAPAAAAPARARSLALAYRLAGSPGSRSALAEAGAPAALAALVGEAAFIGDLRTTGVVLGVLLRLAAVPEVRGALIACGLPRVLVALQADPYARRVDALHRTASMLGQWLAHGEGL